jgi:type I restriction enzyme M protein
MVSHELSSNASDEPLIPGFIIDRITGRKLKDTPEEYVRQNFELALLEEYDYSGKAIEIDFKIRIGRKSKRAAIVIFEGGNRTQENIYLICQAKNPSIKPDDKNHGLNSLKSNLSACVNAQFGVWTNGVDRIVLHKRQQNGKVAFDEIPDFPKSGQTLEELESGELTLRPSVGISLLQTFRRCHNYIHANQGLSKQRAFEEFVKVILAKLYDEKNDSKLFFARKSELNTVNGCQTIKGRVSKLFSHLISQNEYSELFRLNPTIELSPSVISYLVGQLQSVDFLRTETDAKGLAYEELVGTNLRGDRGEFFTPRNVVRMTVEMLDLQVGERVLDPACGTGGFLLFAFQDLFRKLYEQNQPKRVPLPDHEIARQILDIAQNSYGIDFNPGLIAVCKVNMLMNDSRTDNIFPANSLQNPKLWTSEKAQNEVGLGSFDVVVTNPPFGTKIPIREREILEQYDLARKWSYNVQEGRWVMETGLQRSRPPEVLFIERCVQFLKEGGRMGIVVPDGILGNPKYGFIRQWLLEKCKLLASVDLPPETFQPHTGTQTSVILLQKKTPEELLIEKSGGRIVYPVFFAAVKRVGWDKRGNNVYKADDFGRELLDANNQRVIDDETPEVVEAWNKFKLGRP